MSRLLHLAFAVLSSGALAIPAPAQDLNITLPVAEIERLLRHEPFELRDRQDSRFVGDRTQRADLAFAGEQMLRVKWAKSARGGQAFNNEPRYELAAYEIQKLFLDEGDLVVPPTVARAVPVGWYRTLDPNVDPTFSNTSSVLVVLQYWLSNVTPNGVYDRNRMRADTAYARHFANLNLLTHLIWHSDANLGNVLISSVPERPRLFSVDNGVSFGSDESDRGVVWRQIRTDAFPKATVERLRQIRREDLDRVLGVVAQFEIRDGELVPVDPTENLGRHSGVRRKDNVLQLGLTVREITAVKGRIDRFLRAVDSGKYKTF